MEWLDKWVVKGVVKRALDWLPFNSYKTYIGLGLLVVVVALNQMFPTWNLATVITTLIEWVKVLNADDLTWFGGAVAIIGAVHKALKRIYDTAK